MPTFSSLNTAVKLKNLDMLWGKVTPEELEEGGLEAWLAAIQVGWWDGASWIEQMTPNFFERVKTVRSQVGDTPWHTLAAKDDSWEARAFITRHGLRWEPNDRGRTPTWSWTEPGWAEVWMRTLRPWEQRQALGHVDIDGNDVMSHWLSSGCWPMVHWGLMRGMRPHSASDEGAWREWLSRSPAVWKEKWKIWGWETSTTPLIWSTTQAIPSILNP